MGRRDPSPNLIGSARNSPVQKKQKQSITWCGGLLFFSGPPRHLMIFTKNLLMPLFLMGCFPVDFQEVKRPLGMKSGKRPIKVGKRPIEEGKRPIKAMVLVGISVGCLMGCFRAPPPRRKTAPLKRPTKRSMILPLENFEENFSTLNYIKRWILGVSRWSLFWKLY